MEIAIESIPEIINVLCEISSDLKIADNIVITINKEVDILKPYILPVETECISLCSKVGRWIYYLYNSCKNIFKK